MKTVCSYGKRLRREKKWDTSCIKQLEMFIIDTSSQNSRFRLKPADGWDQFRLAYTVQSRKYNVKSNVLCVKLLELNNIMMFFTTATKIASQQMVFHYSTLYHTPSNNHTYIVRTQFSVDRGILSRAAAFACFSGISTFPGNFAEFTIGQWFS